MFFFIHYLGNFFDDLSRVTGKMVVKRKGGTLQNPRKIQVQELAPNLPRNSS